MCVSQRTVDCVREVVDRGKFNFQDRESFGEYMTVLQRCNQAIFADQKKLLAQIKEIKKRAKQENNIAAASVEDSRAEIKTDATPECATTAPSPAASPAA